MPLHLHRAQRSDALVGGLADVLLEPLDDPMATEIVAVPARGIERWLTQRLSHRLGTGDGADGVSANIDFSSPASLVERTISAASGVDPDADPWRVDRLIWPMIATIDACSGEPWCAALADHLGAAADAKAGERTELRRARRLAVAHRLAGLFDAYSSYRPSVLQQWAAGHNTDGMSEPLAAQRIWQPELFRRLREAIDLPSPAERLPAVCRTLRTNLTVVELPSRISVFGPTRLSATELAVFDALAECRDVHIWIPQPSPSLWHKLAGIHRDGQPPRRRSDQTVSAPAHPLLRSLGRDSREFQLRLASCRSTTMDHLLPDAPGAAGVLGRLQADLATDSRPPGRAVGSGQGRRLQMAAGDRSIQVHACHGRARQVEVLRDVLVGLLADDDTLQPRDLLVMCPDIEMYAPFILAAFGARDAEPTEVMDGSHPGTRIRVRLADRALRRTNPVLDVLARLLELAASRMSASQVLDFAGLPPVRRRFGFDDDDLQRLREWVVESGVRWGLNSAARAPYGLADLRQNTWRAGLDRILLGVAMSEDEPDYLGLALPLDDVDSSDIDLAGRLAELVDRLAIGLRSLTDVRPLADWADSLITAIESLAAVTDADSWQLDQARRTIGEATATAGEQATTVPLRLADVERLLADALRGRPTRANFRTGELTICSMVPMRSVPHRVVCLLGLDDGEFPRTGQVDGDDVLAVDPVVGERDRTSEDRQLLLDAIGAATEHLIFLYSGADERTGSHRPPAAALGEILDVLDASALSADGGRARDQLLVRHPLQPFDSRNFARGALLPGRQFSFDRPFSFDLAGLAGATAERSTAQPAPFLSGPLPAPEGVDTIDLDALIRFFEHPAKTFLRDRLGIYGGLSEDEVPDELAVSLDSLQKWSIGERLLQSRLAGVSSDAVQQAEFRRGTLPPGALGPVLLQELASNVDPLVQAAAGYLAGAVEQVDVTAGLPDGRAVAGTIGPLRAGLLTRVTYSSLAPKHRIRAWISILALSAASPSFAVRAVTIGRGSRYQPVATSRLDPPSADRATALLATLVGIRDLGLRSPLPLPPKTAYAYALARVRGRRDAGDAFAKAEIEWKGRGFPGEGADPEHARIWGQTDLLSIATSLGRAESPGETTRFGELAVAIYRPLLDAEELGE
ncbi:MAG: exodeoxyribonuclease V subunit gamma [Actinomycetota bacterium]|nr:exodeoxyribonuclease V subunit gamma [Actinomycetota bacterium]